MNIQRAPQARLRLTITNSIVNETNDNSISSSRNSHFTPCRRVGLSRKKAPNVQVDKNTKNDEPSSSPSQQVASEKHVHKSSLNDNSSMRKNDEINKSQENARLATPAERKPTPTKQNNSESEEETKYSQTPSYTNQRESLTKKSRKKSRSRYEPPPRESSSTSVSNNGNDSDSTEDREELPESKKRKRELYNVNTVEHAGKSNNGISSIEIKNILTGIDPELAKIDESNSPSNLSLSSVKKISIHVKQRLEQNKWSTSTKVHLTQDDQAVSDVDSAAGNSDLSDFSESSSSKRKKRSSTTTKPRRSSPKPGPSRPNTAEKTVHPPQSHGSDSEDDFVPTPKSRPKEAPASVKSEPIGQPFVKLERSINIARNIKSNMDKIISTQNIQDDLNKTEQIRISENKSYNVIYKGNIISYVKSHDNDNLKNTESANGREICTDNGTQDKLSMIVEHKSYITEHVEKDEEYEDADQVDERSESFDMFENLEIPPDLYATENTSSCTTKSGGVVPVKRSKLTLSKTRTQALTQQTELESTKQSAATNNKSSTNPVIHETNINDKLAEASRIRKKLSSIRSKVKAKQEKAEMLKRVSVYKKTHDLDELQAVTVQHKSGAQAALFDMLLLLNSVSHDPCDMKTLLHNMKIPNDLVDYDPEEDKFRTC